MRRPDPFTSSRTVTDNTVDSLVRREYEAGFITAIESDTLAPGLDEDVVRFISAKKREPDWLTEWRLEAYRGWRAMAPPVWAHVAFPPIDFQAISYYSAPRSQEDGPRSLDEVDPELLRTYEKLGIPLHEQEVLAGVVREPRAGSPGTDAEEAPARPPVAVDAVFDSVSIATTFRDKLAEAGVIFCSISEAVREHPELVRKYLGTVVPVRDNFYAALNSAVYSDGSFVYVPKGVRCPMELSTYFRINAPNTGQFERTLIIAERGAYVSYLEGCTAPMRDENQLHAAVVELIAHADAEIKYSTVQNWYPGDREGKGGIYNFVTKRGMCRGDRSKISWTQVETGSAITWKYPSVVLRGNDSVGEFYSVALTNNHQQADTGTKMIHIGRNTRSTIVSKGISAGRSQNTYRGLVRTTPTAVGARNYTQCDSLLIGEHCGAHTFPYIENRSQTAVIEHEASTSKVSEDQLYLCQQRGIDPEKAVSMIVNGFCRAVFRELPMEFAVEAGKLLEVSLEGAVG
jgi:Fe-S cluster assembly protein SufB